MNPPTSIHVQKGDYFKLRKGSCEPVEKRRRDGEGFSQEPERVKKKKKRARKSGCRGSPANCSIPLLLLHVYRNAPETAPLNTALAVPPYAHPSHHEQLLPFSLPPPTSRRATPPPPRCARAAGAATSSYKSNGQSAAVPETSSLPLPFLPRSRPPTPLTPLRVSYGAYAPIPLFHFAGSPPPMFPHIPDLLAQLSQAGRYWRRARRDGWLAG